jgi:hypothetical protein
MDGIDADTIVQAIKDAIGTAVATYTTVGLDLSGAPSGVSVSAVPGSYVGAYDRSIDRMFSFDVTFTGAAVGVHEFDIAALVDGGEVATERDTITVRDKTGVPDVASTGLLLGFALVALETIKRKIRK